MKHVPSLMRPTRWLRCDALEGNLFLMRATKLLDDETLKCRQQHRNIQICRYLGTCTFKTIYNGDVRPAGCPGNAQFRFLNGPTIPIQAERTCRASVICISFVYLLWSLMRLICGRRANVHCECLGRNAYAMF